MLFTPASQVTPTSMKLWMYSRWPILTMIGGAEVDEDIQLHEATSKVGPTK